MNTSSVLHPIRQCFVEVMIKKILISLRWMFSEEEKERMEIMFLFAFESSYMQILFMENFKFNHVRFLVWEKFFGSSMTFDIRSFLKTFSGVLCGFSLLCLLPPSSDVHAFECGETKSIAFYLLLVIDCEKLISKEGCAGYCPTKLLPAGQTVLSSIKSCFSFSIE
jgi:hypothetical protein